MPVTQTSQSDDRNGEALAREPTRRVVEPPRPLLDEEAFPAQLAAARAGDEAGMAPLFRALHPRLIRFLRATEPLVADDLVGEVWMAVAEGLHRFEGDAAGFRAWVFSIARRRIAEHRRRGVRRNTQVVDPATLDWVESRDGVEAEVLEQLSGQRAAELVTAVLAPDQAEVILLRVLADLGVEEVAEVMGRSENWVRVNQHRALRRLARRLGSRLDVIP